MAGNQSGSWRDQTLQRGTTTDKVVNQVDKPQDCNEATMQAMSSKAPSTDVQMGDLQLHNNMKTKTQKPRAKRDQAGEKKEN